MSSIAPRGEVNNYPVPPQAQNAPKPKAAAPPPLAAAPPPQAAEGQTNQHLAYQLSVALEAQRDAQSQGWVTSDLEFNFVDWNVETQALEPRQESNTLTIDQP